MRHARIARSSATVQYEVSVCVDGEPVCSDVDAATVNPKRGYGNQRLIECEDLRAEMGKRGSDSVVVRCTIRNVDVKTKKTRVF